MDSNQWTTAPSNSLDVIRSEADYCVYVNALTTTIVYKLEQAFGSKAIRFRGEDHLVVHCREEIVAKICSENDCISRYELYKDYIRVVNE